MKKWIFVLEAVAVVCTWSVGLAMSPEETVVRIPGSIKKWPIEFSRELLLAPPTAVLVTELPDTNQGSPNTGKGVMLSVPKGNKRSAGYQQYLLVNPEAITGIGTPIPLEAEVVLNETSAPPTAKVSRIVPDSVAAWNRLKTWPAVKKGVSAKTITEIDARSETVSKSVQSILQAGDIDQVLKEELFQKYEAFSRSLGSAFDTTRDFDVARQLTTAMTGVREERLAWVEARTKRSPILNPQYSAYLNARPDSNFSPPRKATRQKAAVYIPRTGIGNAYEGYDKLQAPYPTMVYKNAYQQARATVAICDGDRPFATGTIIGKNLILTCAHAVARVGRGGTPAKHDPKSLNIKVGYDLPEDFDTPQDHNLIRAFIVYVGGVPDEGGDPLDFVLLKADVDGYNTFHFKKAENESIGIRASTSSQEEKMKALREAAFWPIEPLALGNYDVVESDEFDLAGHPEGGAKLICPHGKVLYPPKLKEPERDEMRKIETGQATTGDGRAALETRFDSMYVMRSNPNRSKYYRYTYGNNAPGIGVICSTVNGDSGGAAVADAADSRCIIGILVDGQPGNSTPWKPGMDRHETLLPTTAIVNQLDVQFKREEDGEKSGPEFQEPWYKHYNVAIVERDGTGGLTRRQ